MKFIEKSSFLHHPMQYFHSPAVFLPPHDYRFPDRGCHPAGTLSPRPAASARNWLAPCPPRPLRIAYISYAKTPQVPCHVSNCADRPLALHSGQRLSTHRVRCIHPSVPRNPAISFSGRPHRNLSLPLRGSIIPGKCRPMAAAEGAGWAESPQFQRYAVPTPNLTTDL